MNNKEIVILLKKRVSCLKNYKGIENIDNAMGFYIGDTIRQICDLVELLPNTELTIDEEVEKYTAAKILRQETV